MVYVLSWYFSRCTDQLRHFKQNAYNLNKTQTHSEITLVLHHSLLFITFTFLVQHYR